MFLNPDTIAAIATPPGNGGVGIIRISGALVTEIAKQVLNKPPNLKIHVEVVVRHQEVHSFLGE